MHHKTVLTALEEDPAALVAAAIAHFSALSSSSALVTDTELNLSGYHYDPSFLWAPYEARTAVFTWARDAFMVVFATNSDPYSELPDDCAGDVLEYLMGNMTRRESLHISMHCTSLQARAWVCAMFKAAVAVSKILFMYHTAKSSRESPFSRSHVHFYFLCLFSFTVFRIS